MNIDLMGSTTPTDSDIANTMQMQIDRKYTAAQREQIVARGTAAEKGALTKFFQSMSKLKLQTVADRDLLVATLEHEQAVARLAEPVLDPLAKDADGNLLYPDEPVLDALGKATGKILSNILLRMDADERKDAQAVVDAATPETLALVAKRKAARDAIQTV